MIRLLTILILLSALSLKPVFSAEKPQEFSFSSKLNGAIEAAQRGDLYTSYRLFEELLKEQPDEILVYDSYATVAESHGNYRRAIEICKKWVAAHGAESTSAVPIAERMERLEHRINHEDRMENAESWAEARILGSQIVTFVTNLPDPHAGQKMQEIIDLMEAIKKILTKIFGSEVPDTPLKIYLPARGEEYWQILKQEIQGPLHEVAAGAMYLPEKKMILISSAAMDSSVIAHELAHHYIHAYLQNPSAFVNEGLAEYIGLRLGKDTAKVSIRHFLEGINYLYDQGQWERFLGTAAVAGQNYFLYRDANERRHGLNRFNSGVTFYMTAWAAGHFFAETSDPFFKQFFREYLNYEKNQTANTMQSFLIYFEDHLSDAQMHDLDNQWGRHTVNLTFESA